MLDVCCWRRVQPINAIRLATHERGRRRKGEMVYFDGMVSKDKIANKIVDGDFGVAAGRAASPRPTDGSHLAAVAAAAEELSPPSDSSPDTPMPGGMSSCSRTSPTSGSMRRNSLSSPSQVPCQSSPSTQVTPVTKRFGLDGAKDRPGFADRSDGSCGRDAGRPRASLPPRRVRNAPPSPGAGIVASTRPVSGIDLLDTILGDLEQVLAVEGGSRMRGDIERAHRLAALGIEGVQPVAGRKPDVLPVVGDAVHAARRPERGHIRGGFRLLCRFMPPATRRSPDLATGSAAGSNKVVGNPGTGGAIQRRARPRPKRLHLACPSQSVERALHGARAGAERERQRRTRPRLAVGESRASTSACSSSTGGASTTTSRARRGTSAKPRLRRAQFRPAAEAPCAGARFRPAAARDATCRRRLRPEGAREQRLARLRRRARLRPGRGRARTEPGALRARPLAARRARRVRQASTTSAPDASTPRPRQAEERAPFRARSGAPPACRAHATRLRPQRRAQGYQLARAACPARASAARADFVRMRRIAIPATTSSVAGPRRRRQRRRDRMSVKRPLGFVEAADQQQAPDLEIAAHARRSRGRRAPRASPARPRAPCIGQPRSRETSAISASATTHRARADGLPRAEGRAARRSSAFARTRSPSCAIAMPRSASAGASSRRATRFNAPSGSPAASARAAAVISESIEIPSHLSLPPFDAPAPSVSHDRQALTAATAHRQPKDGEKR